LKYTNHPCLHLPRHIQILRPPTHTVALPFVMHPTQHEKQSTGCYRVYEHL
jgi:hypothetical protein